MPTIISDTVSPADALSRVEARLDLTNVKRKLANPEQGLAVSPERLEVMEAEYRKYLALHLAYPDLDVVPCSDVDVIWHQHILDTAAYRADCEAIFGYFLDHYPYFGMNSDEEAEELHDAYSQTLERYVAAFGDPPEGVWVAEDAARCRRKNCKPQQCK